MAGKISLLFNQNAPVAMELMLRKWWQKGGEQKLREEQPTLKSLQRWEAA